MNIWMESLENARSCESPGSVSSIVVTTAKFCRALSEPTASRHKPNQGNLVTNLVDLKKKIIQKWSQVTVLTLCQWINCAVRFCFLCQSKNRDWKTFQMFILFDSQMLSSPLNIGLGNSVSIFSEACLWWNIFSFDIQMFEYLARVAWALPTLASQIAYIDPDRGHRVKITSSLSSFKIQYKVSPVSRLEYQITSHELLWQESLSTVFNHLYLYLSFCWSGHISSSLWSNISKVKSVLAHSVVLWIVWLLFGARPTDRHGHYRAAPRLKS